MAGNGNVLRNIFFTRGCTQTPTYVEVLPSFAHCRWMNTNTALRKYASPARIRYSNKVLYTMFRTAQRLCSDALFVGCQTFTNFRLASLWMRGVQERAFLVPDDNIVIYGSCTIIKMKTTVVVFKVVLNKSSTGWCKTAFFFKQYVVYKSTVLNKYRLCCTPTYVPVYGM